MRSQALDVAWLRIAFRTRFRRASKSGVVARDSSPVGSSNSGGIMSVILMRGGVGAVSIGSNCYNLS